MSEQGIVWGMVLARTAVFTTLCQLRYRSFFANEWQDVAAANQIAYQTAHGHPFFQTLTDQYFLAHFQPIYLLAALPYRVWPHISTLHFMLSLGLGLGAVPLFWLVRERVATKGAGAFCAALYLCYAPLNYLNLSDFRAVLFAPPILLFALYFLEKKRFRAFLIACLLAMCCKENVSITVILLGAYGFYRHRRARWALWTLIAGVLWLTASIHIAIPLCQCDVRYPEQIGPYFMQWGSGDSLYEFVKSTLLNPMPMLQVLWSYHRLMLLFRLLWPLCFLSVLSPQIAIIGLPGLLQALLSRHAAFSNVRAHWLATAVPFLCASAVYSVAQVLGWCEKRRSSGRLWRGARYPVLFAVAGVSLLANFGRNILGTPDDSTPIYDERFLSATNIYDRRFYTMDAEDTKAWELLSLIPESASVAASGHLLPALSHRRRIVEFGKPMQYMSGKYRDFTAVDYVMVHARCLWHGAGDYWWPGRRHLRYMLQGLLEQGGWEVVKMDGLFVLLRRHTGAALSSSGIAATMGRLESAWSCSQDVALGDLIHEGEWLLRKGELKAAERVFRKAVAMKPRGPFAYQRLGTILRRGGRHAEAASAFREAVARCPLSAALRLDLGMAELKTGDLARAEAEIRRAIWLYPGRSLYHATLGRVLFLRGQHPQAVRALERAISTDPNALRAMLMLARCYCALGQHARAVQVYQQIVGRDRTGTIGREAAKELSQLGRTIGPEQR